MGGGYWGAAAARALRSQGLESLILDSQESGAASKAATGLVRSIPEYLKPAWWEARHQSACQVFWNSADFIVYPENLFHQHQPEPEFKRNTYCLLSDCEIACPEVIHRKVNRLESDGSSWWVHTDQDTLRAAGVVLAAGVWTDAILQASGLPILHISSWPGRGSLHPAGSVANSVLTWAYRIDGDTRTRRVSAIPWHQSGEIYLTEGPAAPLVTRLQLGPAKSQLFGYRPRLRRWEVLEVAPRCIVATGGNRCALAGAAGIALRVAELATAQT